MSKRQDFNAFVKKSPKGLYRELVTEVVVRLGTTVAKSLKLPQPGKKVPAIWDTGSTTTSISSKLANQLNLKPIKKTTLHGINITEEVNVHIIDILLPNQVGILNVHALEVANLGDFDVLIGMDIITYGDFAVTNAGGNTCFSFRIPPANKHINYVEEVKKVKERRQRQQQRKKVK